MLIDISEPIRLARHNLNGGARTILASILGILERDAAYAQAEQKVEAFALIDAIKISLSSTCGLADEDDFPGRTAADGSWA
jgi:hypothetical protein